MKEPRFRPTLIEGLVIAAILAVVITAPILVRACTVAPTQ